MIEASVAAVDVPLASPFFAASLSTNVIADLFRRFFCHRKVARRTAMSSIAMIGLADSLSRKVVA